METATECTNTDMDNLQKQKKNLNTQTHTHTIYIYIRLSRTQVLSGAGRIKSKSKVICESNSDCQTKMSTPLVWSMLGANPVVPPRLPGQTTGKPQPVITSWKVAWISWENIIMIYHDCTCIFLLCCSNGAATFRIYPVMSCSSCIVIHFECRSLHQRLLYSRLPICYWHVLWC